MSKIWITTRLRMAANGIRNSGRLKLQKTLNFSALENRQKVKSYGR